ncbi:MAG: ribokinase [Chloroflexi bacterium]|nr:ribokinase [Chloroflexota bacterium]
MPPRIAVLGSLHLDILVNAPSRPRTGETLAGSRWWLQAGGKGGNQAAQAARLGGDVYMIGRVGQDDFADKLLRSLTQAGVHTDYVFVDTTAGSGMSVAIIEESGDYSAVIVSGVNKQIDTSDLERASSILSSATCLVLQNEIPLETNWAAARQAREAGVRVLLNAAPAYPMQPDHLALVDVLVVNEIEAEMLSGHPLQKPADARAAAEALLRQVNTVIITLGGSGAWAADRSGASFHVPGFRVPVVDTHGAGDAFIGALAVRLSLGDTLGEAVRYANAAGALTCMVAGPQPDSLSHASVQQFLSNQGK